MTETQNNRPAIAEEVRGTSMFGYELEELGIRYGMTGKNIDLRVAMIAEEEGVHNCQICNWWCEESEMHNDVCNDCYALDHDG